MPKIALAGRPGAPETEVSRDDALAKDVCSGACGAECRNIRAQGTDAPKNDDALTEDVAGLATQHECPCGSVRRVKAKSISAHMRDWMREVREILVVVNADVGVEDGRRDARRDARRYSLVSARMRSSLSGNTWR